MGTSSSWAGKGPDRVQLIGGSVLAVDDAATLQEELACRGLATSRT